jgi:hypothetical protein
MVDHLVEYSIDIDNAERLRDNVSHSHLEQPADGQIGCVFSSVDWYLCNLFLRCWASCIVQELLDFVAIMLHKLEIG